MLVPALLAGYALVVACAGTRWLPRAAWPGRAPRLGIAAWQALTGTFVASVLLAALLAAIPCLPDGVNLNIAAELRDHYATAHGIVIGGIAGAVALAVTGRLAWAAASAMATAQRRRARHDETLALVGRPGPVPGVVVLDDARPLVYCLPGRDRVVVTTGALDRLDGAQLQAVLAHERAHLAGRHHLVIMPARVLSTAFGRIRFLAIAAEQTGTLAEMAADDAAARQHRLPLARALLALASVSSPAPAPALNAAGTAAGQRIRRLLEGPRPVGAATRAAGLAVSVLAVPVLALAVPVAALLVAPGCPAA